MSAQIIDRTETGFTVQITIPYDRSMLDFEETLQHQLNTAGVLATQEGLRQFDTDGSPITRRLDQAHQQGTAPQGLPDTVRPGYGRTTGLPEFSGWGHLLPVGP